MNEALGESDAPVDWERLHPVLDDVLGELKERERAAILLRFFEDATLPDIAAVLGCSVGTVKSRLHNALEKLRKMKMNLAELKGDKPI